jgi:hypothetical protein
VGARTAAAEKIKICRSSNSSTPGAKQDKYRNGTE